MLLMRHVKSVMSNDLILYLNPQKIRYYVGSNITKFQGSNNDFVKNLHKNFWFQHEKLTRVSPFKVYTFYIKERDYTKPKPIENIKKYQKINDFIKNRSNFRQSIWYKLMRDEILNDGLSQHKKIAIRSLEELDEFFENYVLDLVKSMESDGYIYDKGTGLGNIMIYKDGTIHKSNSGDHRFFVAKLVGVKLMPFKIKGVHELWLKNLSIPKNKKGLSKLNHAFKQLEYVNR